LSLIKAILILAKFRIMFALWLTALCGQLLASNGYLSILEILKLFVVMILSSLGAKIYNHLLDVKIDGEMLRTANRADAVKKIGVQKLWIIASILVLFSLTFSLAWYHWSVAFIILLALFSYVIWYTLFLKRNDPFGTVLGGLSGALPVFIGSYTVTTQNIVEVWLMFLFMMLWQPPHFWALSLKLKDDYAKAGIPAFAVVYSETYTKLFIYLYAMTLLPVTLFIGYYAGFGQFYFISSILIGFWYIIVTLWSLEKIKNFNRAFYATLIYMVFYMIITITAVYIK